MRNRTSKKLTNSKKKMASVSLSASSGEEGGAPPEAVREKKALRITSLTALILTCILMVAAIITAAGVHDARSAARQEEQAKDFAASLIRTLQSKGLQRVQSQFWNGYTYLDSDGERDIFDGVPFDLVENYDKYGPSNRHFTIYGKKEKESLPSVPGAGKIQRFAILGASYKNTDYDVQIQYDPSGYGEESNSSSHAYNLNSFPNVSSLTSDTTAVINPEGAYVSFASDSSDSYEYDDVSQQFKSETRTMETSAMDRIYARRATFYEKAVALVNANMASTEVHNWNELKGTSFYTTTDKSTKITELKKLTTRNTVIYASGEDGAVTVNASVLFQLTDASFVGDPKTVISALSSVFTNATVTVTAEDGTQTEEPVPETRVKELKKIIEDQINNLYKQSTTDEALTEQFVVYETDRAVSSLENIYLMYYPLRNSEWKSDMISLDFSSIRNQYSKENRLNLYVVPQLGLLAQNKTSYETIQAADYIAPKLAGGEVTFDEDADTVSVSNAGTLYDLTRTRVHYIKGYMRKLAAADMEDSLTEESDPDDIIYQLKVRIYKASEGKFPKGNYLTESSVTSS